MGRGHPLLTLLVPLAASAVCVAAADAPADKAAEQVEVSVQLDMTAQGELSRMSFGMSLYEDEASNREVNLSLSVPTAEAADAMFASPAVTSDSLRILLDYWCGHNAHVLEILQHMRDTKDFAEGKKQLRDTYDTFYRLSLMAIKLVQAAQQQGTDLSELPEYADIVGSHRHLAIKQQAYIDLLSEELTNTCSDKTDKSFIETYRLTPGIGDAAVNRADVQKNLAVLIPQAKAAVAQAADMLCRITPETAAAQADQLAALLEQAYVVRYMVARYIEASPADLAEQYSHVNAEIIAGLPQAQLTAAQEWYKDQPRLDALIRAFIPAEE